MKRVLLVEPNFPYPAKSKNKANSTHKNFVPIGLLKQGAYHRSQGNLVKLARGNKTKQEISWRKPSLILVTSVFTYWSAYVWDAVAHYRLLFPDAIIIVGGIYATLHYDTADFKSKCRKYRVSTHKGLHREAEKHYPDYTLLDGDINHHVTHAMRGCIRKCDFCGTWKIEPQRYDKPVDKLLNELKTVGKNKAILFDNNFLANKAVKEMLSKLANLLVNNRPVTFECQSGFDGRILTLDLATKLKKARFINPRIAWDNSYEDYEDIERQIKYLVYGGYNPKNIYVFMVYNFEIPFEIMEEKRKKCYEFGVQIADCRYRPLNQTFDNYKPQKSGQSDKDYYIHSNWSDSEVRAFRRNVRRQNICIRQGVIFYSKDFEHKKYGSDILGKVKRLKSIDEKIKFLKENNIDYWLPNKVKQLIQP